MIPNYCKLCGGEGAEHYCTGKPSEELAKLIKAFNERLAELEKAVDELLKIK